MERPEFADFWALKWADLLRNEEKTMGEKGAWVLQRWLRDELARDVPAGLARAQDRGRAGLDLAEPAGELPPDQPRPDVRRREHRPGLPGNPASVCARCHNHPFDVWTQDDYYGLAAFFANVARKQPSNARRDRLDVHEINGDEYIYLSGRAEMVQPRTGVVLQPKCLNGPTIDRPAGDSENALEKLADWLTHENTPVQRQPGQPSLVPPARPGDRRPGR